MLDETENNNVLQAMSELEDYNHPLKSYSGSAETICKAFELVINSESRNISAEEKLKLYASFYQRMRYENNAGNLGEFLEGLPFLQKGMEVILTALYGTGDSFYQLLLLWIEGIENVACENRKNVNVLLARLICLKKEYLSEPENANDFIEELENLVSKADEQGYLSHRNLNFNSDENDLSVVYDIKYKLYGFDASGGFRDDVLYLLKAFANNGESEKVDRLLRLLEKSIPLIDKLVEKEKYTKDYEMPAQSEVIKYHILSIMQEMGYNNNFVLYLTDSLNSHKRKIDLFLNNVSRKSNFLDLSFDIELWLEYFWQTKRWGEGQKRCQELLEELHRTANLCRDDVVSSVINDEIKRVKKCKTFLAFMNGEQIDVKFDNERFFGLGHLSLYDGATALYDGRVDTESEFDRQQFISMIEIQMQHIDSHLIITMR